MQRQGGPRFPPPQPGGSWTQGQGGPRLRPPYSGNNLNWRSGWRSTGSDEGQSSNQQRNISGQRLRQGCYICGQIGCHPGFHREGSNSPQVPPAMGCFVCGQRGCHSSRHEANAQPPAPNAPSQPARSVPAPVMSTASPQSNWQRGSNQGERAPQTNIPPRHQ